MDTLRHIKPATLEPAFDLRPANTIQIEKVPGDDKYIPTPGNLRVHSEPLQTQIEYAHKPFIEANTQEVHLQHLKNECIIPVFSKDNEKTISHQEFIEISQNCIANVFPNHSVSQPEIRVSHQIKGRTPGAIYKNIKDLLNHEKTIYYERMAFIVNSSDIDHPISIQSDQVISV